LFFNFSRPEGLTLNAAGKPADYFLAVGGQTYSLQPLNRNPGVLARARDENEFLRSLPEGNVTHYLEDLVLSADITPLAYVGSLLDSEAGAWKMESVVQILSPSAMSRAWTKLSAHSHHHAVPLSAKREFYGMAAAFSESDVREELALVDYTDFARTLVTLHPDMLCANPSGAAYIAFEHVSNTGLFARVLQREGPAAPQAAPDQQNPQGWATLVPLNQEDGTPFKMENGLNQYFPNWNTTVDGQVGTLLRELLPDVKDDVTLGADITHLSPDSNAHVSRPIERELTGKVWYRHDGATAVDHGSEAFLNGPAPTWDFRQRNGETGLQVTRPSVGDTTGGRTEITFDNVANWFFRFLGVYFQFVDPNGKVIPKEELPDDVLPDRVPATPLDRKDALFAGIVPPVFSIAGIPVYPPGDFSILVNLPKEAASVNAFYAGLGLSGSRSDPNSLRDVGLALTVAVNFGMVAFFMATGVADVSDANSEAAAAAEIIANQIVTYVTTVLNPAPITSGYIFNVALSLVQYFLSAQAGRAFSKLVEIILKRVVRAQFLNAVPIAGQIMRAVAAALGVATLATTVIEAGISPQIYQFDLTFTHDLSLNILPDEERGSFPPVTNDEVLYYKINYLFNNGSPHFLDHVDVPDPHITSIPVTLHGIPWGGEVNVSVGFYVRKKSTNPAENDWCASKGTTGLIPNTDQQPPDIVLQDFHIPIVPETIYIHTSKTTLDSVGRHRWTCTSVPPAYVPPSSGQEPGDIGAFRSITVRQRTRNNKGYLGYSWQSYSEDRTSCEGDRHVQVDLAANLNTDQGNHGENAQDGYTVTSCGVQGSASAGLTLSYNLLTDPTANFYLDSSSLMLRQIELDPKPDFSAPGSRKSFGKLNMASTMLVLHPAGYVVSINNASSKLEALRLPPDSLDDSIAAQRFLARTYSGPGSRPGLMRSPVAACVTAEGAILVLEGSTANNRIQAFDLGGNPLRYFNDQRNPYFLHLTATQGWTYLDLAAEFSGYIYVLSRRESPRAFRLDIYHPAQPNTQPICTTTGINAARLTVDFWRNVYTLNYEPLRLAGGEFPGITEPSVSFWLPRSSTLASNDDECLPAEVLPRTTRGN
jgi:hypothetical protein